MTDEVKTQAEPQTEETTVPSEAEVVEQPANMPELAEMAKAGILFGRKRSITHPKMRKYVFTTRTGFEIIDLQKTADQLAKAEAFLAEIAGTGQQILFVGTRPEARDIVKNAATEFKFPFVTNRWLGGTLTNYDVMSTRLNYYIKLKEDQAAGKLDKYTKKERVVIDKEIERLDRLFGGLEVMNKLPAALVVVSADAHETAIREAKIRKIPVVAIANTSASPEAIDYLIPANDTGRASITYILAKLTAAIKDGKGRGSAKAVPTEDKEASTNE